MSGTDSGNKDNDHLLEGKLQDLVKKWRKGAEPVKIFGMINELFQAERESRYDTLTECADQLEGLLQLIAQTREGSKMELEQRYANEPWGKLASEAGLEPINTESQARMAFRFCADKIAALQAEIKAFYSSGYVLTYDIAYEGQHSIEFDSLESVKEWVKNNRSSYGFNYDNLSLRPVVKGIDICELMKGVEE